MARASRFPSFARSSRAKAVALLMMAIAAGPMANAADLGQSATDPQDEPETKSEVTSSGNKPFEIDFLTFGDLYHVSSHHLPFAEGDTDLWFRRLYLTFDKPFSDRLFGRLRFEGNQDGDFIHSGFDADFKDVYLRWSVGRHRLFFGLSPTPNQDLIEQVWGYRHLEKTPTDLQGLPARANGVSAHGPLTRGDRLSYRVMVDSGSEFGTESGEGQKLQLAITWGDEHGWLFDIYGDHQRLSGATDRTTFQVFGAYRFAKGRVGLQYSHQDRQDDPRVELASTFGVVEVSPKVTLVGRVDRLLEPSVKGNDIPYLPISPRAKATLLIAAVELRLHRFFSLMPNVETIRYDDPGDAGKLQDDLLLRLTFYLHV